MKNFIIFFFVNFVKFCRIFTQKRFLRRLKGGVLPWPSCEVNFLFFYFL
jgi:hypothetical protein